MAELSTLPIAKLTLTDFLAIPETKPACEFIDGAIVQKPMPQGKHSAIQSELVPRINEVLRKRKVARAFSELRCTFGDIAPQGQAQRSIVPDVSVFAWERIACDPSGEIANTFPLAPDWMIEILSPDQRQTRVVKNIVYSLKHGGLMGWLIDPDERTVFVYFPSGEMEIFDQPQIELPVPLFAEGLGLTLGELFGWLALDC